MRKRTLNVKLLIGLCVGCAVVLVGIYFLHRFQVRRTAGKMRDRAEAQLQQGDPVEAAASLRQYLNLRPDDYSSYVALADIIVSLPDVEGIDSREISKGYAVLDSVLLKVPRDQPEYDELRRRAVDLTMKVRFYKAALEHLRYLLDRHPADVPLNMHYGLALLGSSEFERAADIYSQLIAFDNYGTRQFQPDPQQVDFDRVVPTRVADTQRARDAARQRWGKGADQIDAYVNLTDVLRHLDDTRNHDAGQLIMDRMVQENENSYKAYLRRQRYHVSRSIIARDRNGDTAGADAEMALAKQDVAKARELAPDDADVLLASAQLALDEKDYATAKQYLDKGIAKHPQDSRMYRMLAITHSSQKETDEALAVVAQGLAVLPSNVQLLLLRSDLQLQAGDVTGVRKTAEEMTQAGVRKELVAYLEARIEVADGRLGPAVEKLTRVRPLLAPFAGQVQRVDFLLGNCYDRLGKPDLAKAAYQRVVDLARESSSADPSLAQARDRLRRLQQQVTRPVAQASPSPDGELTPVATEDAFKIDFEKALQELHASKPNATEGDKKLVEANLRARNQQFEQAQAAYAQARQLATTAKDDALAAKVWTASILAALRDPQQDLAAAQTMLQQAQDEFRGKEALFGMTEENVVLTYAGIILNDPTRGDWNEAAKLVAGAQKQYGDTTLNRVAKMRLAVAQGGDLLEQRLKGLEKGIADRSTVDRTIFWSNIWLHYYRAGLRDDARRSLKSLAQLQPNNLRVFTMLFDLAYEGKDDQGMQDAIASLKGLADNTEWKCCEATRLVYLALTGQKDKAALADAQRLCDEAVRARPEWSKPHQVRADIDMAEGNYAAAVTSYEKAFRLGPPQPAAVRRYSLALSRLGRPQEAQQALNMLSEGQRGSVLPEQQVANLLRIGKHAEALTLAKEVVDQSPDDPRKHIWYGQVLLQAKDLEAAEGEFRRTIELAPQYAQAWHNLVITLVAKGEKEAAEAELRKAQLSLIQDELPAVMAKGCEALGRTGDAEEYYRMACDAKPDSLAAVRQIATFYLGKNYRRPDKLAKATSYLNKMLQLGARDDRSSSDDVRWARRRMAQVLANTRRYQNSLKAIDLLELNRVDGELPREDQITMATLLAAQPEPVLQQQAIAQLAQLSQQGQLSAAQQLLLARLYNRAGNWPKCEQTMSNLLAQNSSNAAILGAYCEMLVARDDLNSAIRQMRRLQSLVADIDANDPSKAVLTRTLRELQARLLAKQGEGQKAVALLRMNLPASPQAKDVPQVRRVADLLTLLKFYPQAELVYRKNVELDPNQTLVLARFLGRHGNLDEAFKLLGRVKATSAGMTALQLAIDSVNRRRDQVGDRYDARIEEWLDTLLASHPQAFQVQVERARLRDGQGKYDEVERIYRDLLNQPALAQGGLRAAVLNNLSYMLASQGKGGDESLRMINEALKIIGPSGELLDTRGTIKLVNGDVQGATEDLKLALLSGRSALKLLHLAMAELAAGNQSAARAALQEAQRAGLDKSETHGLERQKYEQLLRDLGIDQARQSRPARAAA